MRPRKLRDLQHVEVQWIDAHHSNSDRAWNTGGIEHPGAMRVTGYALASGRDYLTLCMGYADDGQDLIRFSVPWGCVKRIRRI